MGTITARKSVDGTPRYTAQIRIQRGGKIVHTEAKTFERKQAAQAWLKRRETELAVPGALERGPDPLLSDVIGRYLDTNAKPLSRSKRACLEMIQRHDVGGLKVSELTRQEISAFAGELHKGAVPATVATYLSHLAAVLDVARVMWHHPVNMQAMEDARAALAKLGIVGKSVRRDRRPTIDELDRLMTYFDRARRRRGTADMVAVIAFAIFSTRRQNEICSLTWEDVDEEGSRTLIRDMKNPGGSTGNHVMCELTPEALAIIQARRRLGDESDRPFPWHPDTVGAAFTRAVAFLGIPDLRFHDLRHEGISRLFEMGWNIPNVSRVSGHQSWSSLQRYAHLRQRGDKFDGWVWFSRLTADTPSRQPQSVDPEMRPGE